MSSKNNCTDLDRALDDSFDKARKALSQEAKLHLATCERCSVLLQSLNINDEMLIPSLPIERFQDSITKDLQPVRPLAPNWVFLGIFAAIFAALFGIGIFHSGTTGWNALSLLQRLTVVMSLAVSAVLLAFAAVAQMVPAARLRFPPALGLLATFALLVIAFVSVFEYEGDPHFVRAGMACLETGISYAVPSAILFAVVLRRGVILHPGLSGAICGMLAGLIGMSVLEMHCPILDLRHILVWHLGVCVLGAGCGLLAGFLGSRVTSFRPHPKDTTRAI